MKLFKYFTWSEIKEICKKLDKKGCEFRHPKVDFVEAIGELNVMKLVDIGFLKDSPRKTYPGTDIPWKGDFYESCYEYGKMFRRIANYVNTPFWLWLKIYVLNLYWFVHKWHKLRIACGHHYAWQEYDGVDLDMI